MLREVCVRFSRVLFAILVPLYCFPMLAQQTEPTSPATLKDPQAVSILNQAISVAGGMQAISAINDYTASGTVTLHEATDLQGSVTVTSLGLNSFRQDATLAAGARTQVMTNGGSTIKFEDGTFRQIYRDAPWYPGALPLPYLLIVRALISPAYSVQNEGVISIDGRSAYDIRLQLLAGTHPPGGPPDFVTRDFFIDASTFQVVMTQDLYHSNRSQIRQVRYSDFRTVNGVLAAFAFDEAIQGRERWKINLNQIGFNTGIAASAFTLTGTGPN
jgi:hypothetical protein